MRTRLFLVLLLSALVIAGRSAQAQPVDNSDRRVARELADEGARLFNESNFTGALDRFERADAIMHVPTLGLWAARSLERTGKLVEASERYVAVIRMQLPDDPQGVHAKAQAEAAAESEALSARLPRVTIFVEGAGRDLVLEIDGRKLPLAMLEVPVPVDPGRHRIVARSSGREVELEIAPRERQRVPARLAFNPVVDGSTQLPSDRATPGSVRAEEPGPGPVLVLGATATALGAALLVSAAGVGGALLARQTDFEERGCGADLADCPSSVTDEEIDDFNALRAPTTGLLIAGGALAVVGTILLVVAPSSSEQTVSLSVGPTGLLLKGRY